jgi:hypothetical protein
MKLRLRKVRVSFADGLFTAKAMEPGQTPKFGADFLLVPGSEVFAVALDGKATKIEPTQALVQVANETWKGRGVEMLQALEASKKCLRDGNKRMTKSGEPYTDYEGLLYFSAKNKRAPELFDIDGKTRITSDNGRIYSGCYVTAIIDVYGLADPKKKGVHASLLAVQFTGDGDAFAGSGSRADASDFEDLSDGASAPADVGSGSLAGIL